MNRTEDQVARFRRVNRRFERFTVAHFPDEHDVGVLADGVLHADFEVDHVLTDFALIDQALLFGEHEFDRVALEQRLKARASMYSAPVKYLRSSSVRMCLL